MTAVEKERRVLMAPGRELALCAKAGIAINRPFGYFVAMTKYLASAAKSRRSKFISTNLT
jgi:hypothetical protein